jgi:pimeloyl-ACP methyl ester carboxylesterase
MSANPQDGSPRPTAVLVHGAFADSSGWNGVVERLQADGVQVTAPANPLRGISIDSAYIASLLGQTSGPVIAVDRSYGGAVITTYCGVRPRDHSGASSPASAKGR